MGLKSWSASNYLSAASVPVTAYPFLFSIWFNSSAPATDRIALVIGTGVGNRFAELAPSASDRNQAACWNGTTYGVAQSAASALTTSTWIHCTGTFQGSADRDEYVGGTNKVSNTTSVTGLSTPTNLRIGANLDASQPCATNDGIAEASIWDTTGLSSTDRDNLAAQLATSANPIAINGQAQPWAGKMVWYRRLFSVATLNTGSGSPDLTMTGTLTDHASHPTVDAPPASTNLMPQIWM